MLSIGIYTLQAIAQRHAVASHAAVIYSSEGLFSALLRRLVLDEQIGPTRLAGAPAARRDAAGAVATRCQPGRLKRTGADCPQIPQA